MLIRFNLLLIFILTFLQVAHAKEVSHVKESIVVFHRTYMTDYSRKQLEKFAELSKAQYGDYEFVKSADMEQGRAFAELEKGNIDLIIAAPSIEREQLAKVVYLPIDRGLLGFRICMVHKESPDFSAIQNASQFIENKLTIGVGSHWPDRTIFEDNGFKVVTSPVHGSLFSMLKQKRFDCLTRSVNEIKKDIELYGDTSLIADEKLLFIYPNADFIFINPKNKKLYDRLNAGVDLAIENNSFYEIFDEYYKNELLEHNIYKRKLVFLKNSNITPEALSAINRFGIASFVNNPIVVNNQPSPFQSSSGSIVAHR